MCTNYAFQGEKKGNTYYYPASVNATNSARIKSKNSISTFWSTTSGLNTVITYVNTKKHPIIVSFNVRSSFVNANSTGRLQKDTNKSKKKNFGSHAALLVGFVDNKNLPAGVPKADEKGYFIMKNSWGTRNGDCGFYYVDYKYLREYGQNYHSISIH